MITTYCTDNYYRWAELFLLSWKATNDNSEKICINTLNFNENQIKSLKELYENLIIVNENMDFSKIYGQLGMTAVEFERCRVDIKEGVRNVGKNRYVMDFFGDDKRIASIQKTMNEYKKEKYFFQWDIDLLFRKPIEILKMSYDAGLNFRLEREYECRKIPIGVMFFKNNKKTIKLIKDWIEFLRSVPLNKREIQDVNKEVWGQYAFYQAYKMNKLKTFVISSSYYDNQYQDESVVWSANRRINGNKTNTYNFFKAEYENNIRR